MPFISTEDVKQIRNQIKTAFPQFKVSVTCRDYRAVQIAFMEGPVELGPKAYEQVSEGRTEFYQVADELSYTGYSNADRDPVAAMVLKRAFDIGAGKRGEGFEDSDYGYVPAYYVNVSIGKWDKGYQVKNRTAVIR